MIPWARRPHNGKTRATRPLLDPLFHLSFPFHWTEISFDFVFSILMTALRQVMVWLLAYTLQLQADLKALLCSTYQSPLEGPLREQTVPFTYHYDSTWLSIRLNINIC